MSMAAAIICLVAKVPDGTTLICSNNTRIRIAGLESGELVPGKARRILAGMTIGRNISCLPAGNEGSFIVAKCTLPDHRDLACALINTKAGVRSVASWQRYGLQKCD